MRDDIFVFTEAYNCGRVLNPSLKSYHKYHDQTVHIFGRQVDFEELDEEIRNHPNNKFIDLTQDTQLVKLFNRGHAGTSCIFASVFANTYGIEKVIHFDSDTVFRKESLSAITDKFDEGYNVIGVRRPYKHNLCNMDDIRHQPDTISTYFFGMDNTFVSKVDFELLRRRCEGTTTAPQGWKVIDFFDPVSYDALNNGAKFHFLDQDEFGGQKEEDGSLINKYGDLNKYGNVGDHLVHFAGVGSGYVAHKKKGQTMNGYMKWALPRYAMYCKIFFSEDLDYEFTKEEYDIDLINRFVKILE